MIMKPEAMRSGACKKVIGLSLSPGTLATVGLMLRKGVLSRACLPTTFKTYHDSQLIQYPSRSLACILFRDGF